MQPGRHDTVSRLKGKQVSVTGQYLDGLTIKENWKMKFRAMAVCVIAAVLAVGGVAQADYSNGFETDISGWDAFGAPYNPTRVASGNNGITSASGSYHAESSSVGSAGNWGGYNYGAGDAVPTVFQEYVSSVDIYLDVGGGWANDTRFDFDSAINNSAGTHKRDFIFNGGFYDSADVTGPGAGTDRFVISASNNSQPGSAYAKNPDKSPIAIGTTGWYTFEHQFYDNAGVLAVDMSIYDSATLVNAWTLSDATDLITGIGGNRYGWFSYNQFSVLAFDDSSLTISSAVIPLPAAAWMGFALLGGMGAVGAIRRKFRKT